MRRLVSPRQVRICIGAALLLALAVAAWLPMTVSGQESDPLDDPLVLGAWLYVGNCVSCHGPYEKARLGEAYDEDGLIKSIEGGSGGCQVSWARRLGGSLGKAEIKAIVLYILSWEELGHEPDLPALPAQSTPTQEPTPRPKGQNTVPTEVPTPTAAIPPDVQRAIQGNPLALGAWLYTQNCYRCHLGYDRARQGKSMSIEQIQHAIESGKPATTMKAFARKNGGTLKNSEIEAIVRYIQAFEQLDAPPALPAALFIPPTPDPVRLQTIPLPEIPWVKGDEVSGATLFTIHCQACHGQQGAGQFGPHLAKKVWSSVRPDLTVQATIRDGVPGTRMRGWAQDKGGPLSAAQIADLTSVILLWDDQAQPRTPESAQPASLPDGWWVLLPGVWGILLVIGKFRKSRIC